MKERETKKSKRLTLLLIAVVILLLLKWSGHSSAEAQTAHEQTPSKGVLINGVRWATSNVAAPGVFAAKPEDAGAFYQWNAKMFVKATHNAPEIATWEKTNDPSPAGWRVPTADEIKTLCDKSKVDSEWTTQNRVRGRKFTDKASGNSIFLPAAGFSSPYINNSANSAGSIGNYWSSTNNEGYYGLYFYDSSVEWYSGGYRWDALSIRPVADGTITGSRDILHVQQKTDTLHIFFDIDKSVVDDNNAKPLDKLIANKNIISIAIHGYTDFLGGAAYNRQLSEKRSANIRNYLIRKGIDNKKITLVAKGEGVHPNSDEKNRQDLSDKGIQAHRMVRIVYTVKSQDTSIGESLSEENLVAGNNIVLKNILFHVHSDEFRPKSYAALEELFEAMQESPTLKIEIEGHICCQKNDTEEYYFSKEKLSKVSLTKSEGKPLSLFRAKAVRDYLVEKGIDSTRMTCKGYGATRKRHPLERNWYESEMNRRVEILILEK